VKGHVYSCENLVVGNTLESAILAYVSGATYIQNTPAAPFVFECFDAEDELGFLNIENTPATLVVGDVLREVGVSKLKVWEKLIHRMALLGKIPFSNQTIRLRVRGTAVRVILKETRAFDFEFKNLILCDDEGVSGLPPPQYRRNTKYTIYDWFNVHQGCTHKYDALETDDKLVSRVDFYPSVRIDGNDGTLKDMVATSYADRKEQLFNIEYSDLYSRLKAIELLKTSQIFGEKGTPPKIELNRRDVVHHTDVKYEFEEDNISFVSYKLVDMLRGKFDW